MLHAARKLDRLRDDPCQRHILALAVRDVRREHRLRAGGRDAIGERAGAEAGEDDRVNRTDAHAGEHQHDRLRADRHVDRDPVAAADSEAAQRRRRPADLVTQLGVGEDAALAALVEIHDRGAPALAALDMDVDALPGEVRLRSGEPAEARRLGDEGLVPAPQPRQLIGGSGPELGEVGIRVGGVAPHDGVENLHRRH